jgi:thymidylate kinase
MQITITGPRGGGATTLGWEIGSWLAKRGQNVMICEPRKGMVKLETIDALEEPLHTAADITIVTGLEVEDECSRFLRKRRDKTEEVTNEKANTED